LRIPYYQQLLEWGASDSVNFVLWRSSALVGAGEGLSTRPPCALFLFFLSLSADGLGFPPLVLSLSSSSATLRKGLFTFII